MSSHTISMHSTSLETVSLQMVRGRPRFLAAIQLQYKCNTRSFFLYCSCIALVRTALVCQCHKRKQVKSYYSKSDCQVRVHFTPDWFRCFRTETIIDFIWLPCCAETWCSPPVFNLLVFEVALHGFI